MIALYSRLLFAWMCVSLKVLTPVNCVIYPTKIKDVVSKMTQLTQNALRQRHSRMEIELPPTADFGVESTKKSVHDSLSLSDQIRKSNRESARLFTEMFSSISSTTAVLFPSEDEASYARNIWGATFRGKVLSIDTPGTKGYGKLRSRKFSAMEQEQALFGSEGIYVPPETEVLVVAGPRAKDINKIKKISKQLTEATLIVLLNSRAAAQAIASTASSSSSLQIIGNKVNSTSSNCIPEEAFVDWVDANYVSVLHYAPAPLPENLDPKRDLLLYHEFGSQWYLAAKETNQGGLLGALGSLTSSGFTTIWEGDRRPGSKDIAAALSSDKYLSMS